MPRLGSSSSHRGNDAHLVLFGNRRREVIQVADILIIHIHVDESAQLFTVEDAFLECRVQSADLAEDFLVSVVSRVLDKRREELKTLERDTIQELQQGGTPGSTPPVISPRE